MGVKERNAISVIILGLFLLLAWGSSDTDDGYQSGSSSTSEGVSQDVENAYAIGELAVASGVAVEYDVSGWGREIDITISSILPGDARTVANELCKIAKELEWTYAWSIRVFLTVGDRPAAVCQTK